MDEFPGIESWASGHSPAYHGPGPCADCVYLAGIYGPPPPSWAIEEARRFIWKRDNPTEWAKAQRRSRFTNNKPLKESVKTRDGYRCRVCGSECLLTVDHIVPMCLGGEDDAENLWTLCRTCNGVKGSRPIPRQLYLLNAGVRISKG